MFGLVKGLTKAVVAVASTPVAMIADVATAGGALVGRDKMFTQEAIEKIEEGFEEMDDDC